MGYIRSSRLSTLQHPMFLPIYFSCISCYCLSAQQNPLSLSLFIAEKSLAVSIGNLYFPYIDKNLQKRCVFIPKYRYRNKSSVYRCIIVIFIDRADFKFTYRYFRQIFYLKWRKISIYKKQISISIFSIFLSSGKKHPSL